MSAADCETDVLGGAGRRNAQPAGITVEAAASSHPHVTQATTLAGVVLLAAPLWGKVEVAGDGFHFSLDTGSAVLLGKPGPARIMWAEGARGAVLSLPRNRIQALASQRFGEPQRLAAVNLSLERGIGADGFGATLEQLLTEVCLAQAGRAPHRRTWGELDPFCERLIGALERQGVGRHAFAVAQSVKRAMDWVYDCGGPCDEASLALVAGVTVPTLRKSFRDCLGMSLPTFVLKARLETVRRQLASAYDSRPLPAVAHAAGFTSASGFSRAYLRLIGETPTQTRVRAVRSQTRPDGA